MTELWHFVRNTETKSREFLKAPGEPEMKLDFEVDQHDFVKAGKASADIKKVLKRLGVESNILRRMAIASYEAEINITAHSLGGTIECSIYPELVQIIFSDKGPGMDDIEKCMEPGYSTASEYVQKMGFGAGLGLPNIKRNSDMMHITSEVGTGTVLKILIFFHEL